MKLKFFALSTLIVTIGLCLPARAQRVLIHQIPIPDNTIIQEIERPPYSQDFFRQGQEQFDRQVKLLMQGKYSTATDPLKICYEIITPEPLGKPEIRILNPCRNINAIHTKLDNNVEMEPLSSNGFTGAFTLLNLF